MSEDFFGCPNLGSAVGMSWVEARGTAGTARHPPMHVIALL